MNSLTQKIIAGGPSRPTRLHTERGEMIPLGELRHVAGVILQKAATILTGVRPDEPWWPMLVMPIIEAHLTPSSYVIEFGSGS